MKATVRTGAAVGLLLAGAGAAAAAEPVRAIDASAAVVAATGGLDSAETLTGRASVSGQAGWLFENQIELGVGAGLIAERDRADRDPIGGRVGNCAPASPGCPSLGGAPLRGFASGYFASGPAADQSARLSLESAYLYLRGGWGEVSVGRDQGAARRLSVQPPTILAVAGVLDAPLDPTGGAIVLRNDVAGQSAKVFAASTPILGFQAAASWTPRQENQGLDRGFRERAGAAAVFDPEQIWEGALSFDRTLGGWKTAASVTYAQAEDRAGRPAFGDMKAWSAGASLGHDRWRIGASWLQNDNGWAVRGRDYRAFGASAVLEGDRWAGMLEVGVASDDLVHVDQRSAGLSVRRSFSAGWAAAGGVIFSDRDSPLGGAGGRSGRSDSGLGAFLELSFAKP